MNIQILSNSKNKDGNQNFTNLFTMDLNQPIDGEASNKLIRVLNVSYPKTTKNVYDDRCFFYLKIGYANFKSEEYTDPNQQAFLPRKQVDR